METIKEKLAKLIEPEIIFIHDENISENELER